MASGYNNSFYRPSIGGDDTSAATIVTAKGKNTLDSEAQGPHITRLPPVDILIVGSGLAGLTAAIELARLNKNSCTSNSNRPDTTKNSCSSNSNRPDTTKNSCSSNSNRPDTNNNSCSSNSCRTDNENKTQSILLCTKSDTIESGSTLYSQGGCKTALTNFKKSVTI